MFKVRALKTSALLANIGEVQENLEGDADGRKGHGEERLSPRKPTVQEVYKRTLNSSKEFTLRLFM